MDTDGSGELEVVNLVRESEYSAEVGVLRAQLREGLSLLSEGRLLEFWHIRKTFPPVIKKEMIRRIWDELETRHEGLTRVPISLRIPFVKGLDPCKMRARLEEMVEKAGAEWPHYIREWHKQHIKVTTIAQRSVADIM